VDGIAVADAVRAGACVPRDAGPQAAALYAFGLDTGARKGEICGLRWTNLDLESGHAHIVEQLTKPGPHPVFGPPKNGKPRNVTLASDTVELLRAHKKHQALFRMKNRTTYHDFGLVFAKEWGDVRTGRTVWGSRSKPTTVLYGR
jgi:integrase